MNVVVLSFSSSVIEEDVTVIFLDSDEPWFPVLVWVKLVVWSTNDGDQVPNVSGDSISSSSELQEVRNKRRVNDKYIL